AGYAHGCLAGAGAFDRGSNIIIAIFLNAGKVGMAGTRYGNGVNVFSVALLCHYFGPVVIIFFKGTIGHLHGNRGTGCFAKAYAGRDFGSIFLKSHPSTPSVSFLPTCEM